jgi:hypothetical protein
MPQVDSNRLKGNYGVAVIVEKLSAHCLVRQVTADTDIGVDLYCETVTSEGRPFLHFWLQVKTGAQCKKLSRKEIAAASFSKEHLAYWKRQPVPVFAILVPIIGWPPKQADLKIYIADITTHVLTEKLPKKTRSIRSKYVLSESPGAVSKGGQTSASVASVADFLNKIVPAVTARLEVSNGVVAKVPTYTPEYIQHVPNVPVVEHKDKILEQVRCTAALSIIQLWRSRQFNDKNNAFITTLAKVVKAFEGDPHWENPMALGLAYHFEGKFNDAILRYEMAKGCFQGDPSKNPVFLKMVPEVEKAIAHAHANKPVQGLKMHI